MCVYVCMYSIIEREKKEERLDRKNDGVCVCERERERARERGGVAKSTK